MMKYAITGHTNGIGKYIYQQMGLDIKGFSRSNGFDIDIDSHRKEIVRQVSNCDVFINNAHSGFSQCYLLIDLIKEWQHLPKKIINVGSRVCELELPPTRFDLLEYQAEKTALKSLCQRFHGKFLCEVEYRSFGYVGTEEILKKYTQLERKDYILVEEAAKIIIS